MFKIRMVDVVVNRHTETLGVLICCSEHTHLKIRIINIYVVVNTHIKTLGVLIYLLK